MADPHDPMPPAAPDVRCCGAKTRAGGQCRQPRMPNGKCRLHGGKSLAGIASPSFKNGKRSKYLEHLPDTLAAHFNPDDPNLIELREELALLDTGIVELLQQVKAGQVAAPQWSEAQKAWDAFKRARDFKDATAMVRAAQKVDEILTAGALVSDAVLAIGEQLDRRGRLVAVESRRRKDEHEMVERAEFGRFAKAFLMACSAHVQDRAVRAKIQEDALRILALSQVPLLAGAIAS